MKPRLCVMDIPQINGFRRTCWAPIADDSMSPYCERHQPRHVDGCNCERCPNGEPTAVGGPEDQAPELFLCDDCDGTGCGKCAGRGERGPDLDTSIYRCKACLDIGCRHCDPDEQAEWVRWQW